MYQWRKSIRDVVADCGTVIGYGDNIGSGFQKILTAWNTLGYLRPDLRELDDVKDVWLSLPLVRARKGMKEQVKRIQLYIQSILFQL